MKKLLLIASISAVSLFGYMDCASCHSAAFKPLDKMTQAQIVKIMNEYKSGKKSGTMTSVVASMSEADIKASAKKYGKK
jgi:cytochrome c553